MVKIRSITAIFLCKISTRRIILHEKGGFILSCLATYLPWVVDRTQAVEGWILRDVNVRKFSTLFPL